MSRQFAHQLIAETAKEMAAVWYDEAAKDNDFYKFYPQQKLFISREWKRFIDAAKTTLTLMLGRHDVEEWKKEQIHDALIKHAQLPGNIDPRVVKRDLAQPVGTVH